MTVKLQNNTFLFLGTSTVVGCQVTFCRLNNCDHKIPTSDANMQLASNSLMQLYQLFNFICYFVFNQFWYDNHSDMPYVYNSISRMHGVEVFKMPLHRKQ